MFRVTLPHFCCTYITSYTNFKIRCQHEHSSVLGLCVWSKPPVILPDATSSLSNMFPPWCLFCHSAATCHFCLYIYMKTFMKAIYIYIGNRSTHWTRLTYSMVIFRVCFICDAPCTLCNVKDGWVCAIINQSMNHGLYCKPSCFCVFSCQSSVLHIPMLVI